MLHFLKSITSPIISLFVLIIGNGFLMTLVPIRAGLEGFAPETAGYLAAAYFAGILIGALRINKIIEGVGHIRAFAFFASLISVLTLLQGIFVYPWVWLLIRFLFGLSMAGIFITIESWLLVKSSMKRRGIALSIYMTVFYAAQSAGQLLLGVFDPQSLLPFCFIVILASLSVLPLTITKTKAPIVEEQSVFSPWKLFKVSPLVVFAAILSGLILGPIYGLLPIYAQEVQYSIDQTSWIMGSVIFGGLVFQWPIGFISDRVDRRKVLLCSSIAASLLSLFIFYYPQMTFPYFLLTIIFFGGCCFVLYPLSVSHACDLVDAKDIVATTGAVLLSYGLGSIIGPIIASYMIRLLGSGALFLYLFFIATLLACITLFRVIIKVPVREEEKLPYLNLPQTTLITSELDPRAEEAMEKEKHSH